MKHDEKIYDLGILDHFQSNWAKMVKRDINDWYQIKSVPCGECLCNYDFEKDGKLPYIVLLHPDFKGDCCEKSKLQIEANPETKFYILAVGTPMRRNKIGSHPNVFYLDAQGDSFKKFNDMLHENKEKLKTRSIRDLL